MRAFVTIILLAVASCLQVVLSQTIPIPEKPADAKNLPSTKQKTLSVSWQVYFPFVACENGKPVLNVEIPDENAPTALCPSFQSPDTLPNDAPSTPASAHDGAYQVGTVIVMGVSHDKIVLAADSRNVRVTRTTLPNGSVKTKIEHDDSACKLTELTPTILFAADGQVSAENTLPASVLYDAHKLARLAAQRYHPGSRKEQLASGTILAIAERWAWDVDFRMHHGFEKGWEPIQTLEGIFAGLEPSGETAIAVAKLEYPRPRSGFRVPPVAFSIGTLKPPPTDFTWVEAFGMKDVAETYYSARAATQQTKTENKRISNEILKKPALFSPKVPEHLVDLTIQHYQAAAGQGNPLFVHGPIDVAVLERNKEINWIHAKKCSGSRPPISAMRRD